MMLKKLLFVIAMPFYSAFCLAVLVDGATLEETKIETAVSSLKPGSILIVSELHGFAPHHANQVSALHALAASNSNVSVGLEFFEKPDQTYVDQYVGGALSEAEFLNLIRWGSIPFENYKAQALFSASHQGYTVALNAPRSLTSKISKSGLNSLDPKEREQLPFDFTLGNPLYLERFKEAMGEHVPAEMVTNYFAAQSAWDEVMATTAIDFLNLHPEQVLVIIVGDFHAQYGGGLPDRLRARGAQDVKVISQVDATGLSADERISLIQPNPRWGVRADFVWISE